MRIVAWPIAGWQYCGRSGKRKHPMTKTGI
jgi:hypothetical protein